MQKRVNKTIAWIEDDAEVLFEVIRPLENIGCKIVTYQTAKHALQAIDEIRSADLILLDTFFPTGEYPVVGRQRENDYTGIHLAKELRQRHGVKAPIVVFTVVTRAELEAELDGLDVDDIIQKPVRPSVLKQLLLEILARGQPIEQGE